MTTTVEQLPISLRTKREIKFFREAEARAVEFEYGIKDEVWSWYGGMVCEYDATFAKILDTFHLCSFRHILAERAFRGLPTYVLDLMGGDASFLRDLKYPANKQETPSSLDVGLCVTLVDGRRRGLQELDQRLNIGVLCGDLTSKKTWAQIDEKQQEMGIDAFDLIVCRGAGGVAEEMVSRALYPFLFSKVWGRLSDKGGLFITQLPETVNPEELLGQLRLIPGIKLDFQPPGNTPAELYPSLGIIKSP